MIGVQCKQYITDINILIEKEGKKSVFSTLKN